MSSAATTVIPRGYLTDTGPGSGRRTPPRARVRTDAPSVDLDGDWAFRLLPNAPGESLAPDPLPVGESPEDFASGRYDDSQWGTIPVPSHWVLTDDAGDRGRPIYTNVQFPFPTEPPIVPDANPTGDYRRRFVLPADIDPDGRVLLRFDGVESRYAVWVNGHPVGVGTGSRLAQEFDVSGLLEPGENVLAVRVHQWSAGSFIEDQDHWWLPGIFRSVALLQRPDGALDDVWLRTSFDGTAGEPGPAAILPEITAQPDAFPVRLRVPELGVDVTWQDASAVEAVHLESVEPWSAERPRLYDAIVASTGETVTMRLGFRSVRIDGTRLLVNGRPVRFRGVNRPEIHPDRGRVFDEASARRDLETMKRFNVNAVRTAHYPPHPDMLALFDEYGFWVVLENDLETHGFEQDAWADNPSDEPAWAAAYLDRIERTVERDKNHAAVVIWSLGNEAGTGQNLAAMADWVHRRDPERPVHYEGDYTGVYTDVYSRMYAWPDEVERIGAGDGSVRLLGTSEAETARQLTKPFLLCEYAHAMGNGPGAIQQYEDLFDRYERLHGGFVWEWRDHGLRTTTPDGTEFFAYGGDFGEIVHDGNFIQDGMLLSDGTPSPGLTEWAAVVAPVRVARAASEDGSIVVRVENHQHSATTEGLRLRTAVEHDGNPVTEEVRTLGDGDGDAGPISPGGAREFAIEPPEIALTGETWLTVQIELARDTPWGQEGHVLGFSQFDLSPARALPAPAPRPQARSTGTAGTTGTTTVPRSTVLGAFRFESGSLVEAAGRSVAGPRLELWRAPTDNDRAGLDLPQDRDADVHRNRYRADSYERRTWPSSEDVWTAEGLDRLQCRRVAVEATADRVHVVNRYAPASSRRSVVADETWTLVEDGVVELDVRIVPSSTWDTTWPRVGVRFDLPTETSTASWFGTGPNESYPDSRRAARVGRFSADIDDLVVQYGRPQESGHRTAFRTLSLAGADHRPWIVVESVPDVRLGRPGFTLRRHTTAEVTAAAHPHELPASSGTYLWIDAAQHGLGSRACGPDVAPEHRLRPAQAGIRVRFRTGNAL